MVADQNVFFDSKVSVLKINSVDLSAYVKEVVGLPGQVKLNDITTFGKVGESLGPSIKISHFTVKFLFNMITTTGVWATLNAMYESRTPYALEYYPAGTTVGNLKIINNAAGVGTYLADCKITSRVGDYVTVDCDFQVDNGVTLTTA